jgi:hypothetical protein
MPRPKSTKPRVAKPKITKPKLITQRERLRDVLLCAARLDQWMTLGELARKTNYAEPSVSAQLRHLRKREYGGFIVNKRHREVEETKRESTYEKVWEYQMTYGLCETPAGAPVVEAPAVN